MHSKRRRNRVAILEANAFSKGAKIIGDVSMMCMPARVRTGVETHLGYGKSGEEKGASVFQTGKHDEMAMEVEILIMRTQRE